MSGIKEGDRVFLRPSQSWTQPYRRLADTKRPAVVGKVYHNGDMLIRFDLSSRSRSKIPDTLVVRRPDLDLLPAPSEERADSVAAAHSSSETNHGH